MRTGILKGRKQAQVNVKCFNEPFVIYIAYFKSKQMGNRMKHASQTSTSKATNSSTNSFIA